MDPASPTVTDFLHPFERGGVRGLRTSRGFRGGERVCGIPALARLDRPSRYTVQVAEDAHVEVGLLTVLNHSCDPNVRLDTGRMEVVAARDIEPGDELAYFYPATEWDMAEPFECDCGAAECLGVVRGAKHLPGGVLDRHALNPHIRRLLRARPAD